MPDSQRTLSAELVERLAAIDIGTNSARLVVAEPLRGGNYRILDEERESSRLGRSLHGTGRLDPQSMDNTIAALRRFQEIVAGYHVSCVRTIATCAVREAKNGKEFCARVSDELGLDVEVISAEQEAHLAFYSVKRHFDLRGRNIALADIGGGSTEIVLASGNLIEAVYTTQLGAVRMSEIYGSGQSLAGDDYDRLIKGIDRRIKKQTKKPMFTPHLMIGSGGTFTSLAEMIMAQRGQDGLPVRGYQVSRAELRHLVDRLRKLPPKARRDVPGLNPDRADIIVAGLVIIDRIMRRFKINTIQCHNRGVRDGLLLTMIESLSGSEVVDQVSHADAVERLAESCGTDLKHGRHVARLAVQIWDQLAALGDVDANDRTLLDAGARLQDVGYLINYDQHHKHSYHLILNSRLRGFRPHELEIIANVARYHRGAEPKKKHANFRQLSEEDRTRVRRLAGVLRLADGLDRSHLHQIETLQISRQNGELELVVYSPEYPETDIWGARRRAGLLEKTFGTSLAIDWGGPVSEANDDAQPAQLAATSKA